MTARRLLLALLPAGAATITALVLAVAGVDPWISVAGPLASPVVVTGVVASLALVIGTVTRGRRAAALVAAETRARDAERTARRRFLARLDHELKNPVTAIRSALSSMAPDDPGVQVATAQAARVSALVGDLNKLADLETRTLERAPVDLEQVARDAVEAADVEPGARSFAIDFPTVPWPVPAVLGDADLLVVAVYNLVANAVKYSDRGASILLRASEADGWVTLEFSDTGWGIAPADLAGVWDELARGGNARGVDGSGLGLSIVRVIAERHGGSATIQSEPGRGTRVALRLPVAARSAG